MPGFTDGYPWLDIGHMPKPDGSFLLGVGQMSKDELTKVLHDPSLVGWDGSQGGQITHMFYDETHIYKGARPMARLDDIKNRLAALEAEAAEIARYGPDAYFDGDILTFKAQFSEAGPEFTYAAIKADGKWWLTGNSTLSQNWDEMVDLFRRGNVRKVKIVTQTRKVVG